MLPRQAVLLTEHAVKHAHPERATRAEGSLLAVSPSKSSHPNELFRRQHVVRVSPLSATLMNLLASVANKRLTGKLNPLDATLTKNTRGEGRIHAPSPTSKRPLYFLALTNCKFHNSFVLTFIQICPGGVPPSPWNCSHSTSVARRNLCVLRVSALHSFLFHSTFQPSNVQPAKGSFRQHPSAAPCALEFPRKM
jgi:hypothetical protein